MNKQELIDRRVRTEHSDGNELIAQFEGYEPFYSNGYNNYEFDGGNNTRTHVDLWYHRYPHWMNPVITLISRKDDGHFVDVGCPNFSHWKLLFVDEATDPLYTFNAVVVFIKEYNKTKKADDRCTILNALREFKFNESAEFIVEDDFEALTYQLLKRLNLPYEYDADYEIFNQ